jgi:hypothetical protein
MLLSIENKHTILVIGDMNYIDPVYMKAGLDEKSDAYSLEKKIVALLQIHEILVPSQFL